MHTAVLWVSCLVGASVVAPAVAEELDRVVIGLNYRVSDGEHGEMAQAARLRLADGKVLVRYPDARTEWVAAARLVAQPQPVSTDAGPYLFVAAALACLLDERACMRARAEPRQETAR